MFEFEQRLVYLFTQRTAYGQGNAVRFFLKSRADGFDFAFACGGRVIQQYGRIIHNRLYAVVFQKRVRVLDALYRRITLMQSVEIFRAGAAAHGGNSFAGQIIRSVNRAGQLLYGQRCRYRSGKLRNQNNRERNPKHGKEPMPCRFWFCAVAVFQCADGAERPPQRFPNAGQVSFGHVCIVPAFRQPNNVRHDEQKQKRNAENFKQRGTHKVGQHIDNGMIRRAGYHDLQSGIEIRVRKINQLFALARHADARDSDIRCPTAHRIELVCHRCNLDPFVFQIQLLRDAFPQVNAESLPRAAIFHHEGRKRFCHHAQYAFVLRGRRGERGRAKKNGRHCDCAQEQTVAKVS